MKVRTLLGGFLVAAAWAALATGCGESSRDATNGSDDHGHAHDAGHDHDHDHGDGHHHGGAMLALGEVSVGAFTVTASREEEPVEAGGEAGVDVTVVAAQAAAKVAAVRLWIGLEDASGSIKARAEAHGEGGWHTHVEAPSPLPEGSRLWVEIEDEAGGTSVGSFDLKA